MMRKALQAIGLLAVVGALGASVAAILTLKEKVHVTIAGESSERKAGPDPVALLRDDVSGVRADLSSLAEALSKNFEALAARSDPSDAEAARRRALEEALAPLRESLGSLSERVVAAEASSGERDAATRREIAAGLLDLRSRIERLESLTRAATPAVATPPVSVAAAPPASTPAPAVPAEPAEAPLVVPARPAAAQVPAPAAAAPAASPTKGAAPPAPPVPPKKAFLQFKVATQNADFSQRLRFDVLPSLSRVGFDAKSTLHDFSGATSEVAGWFTTRLASPGGSLTGEVRAGAATLDTGIEDRNAEMRRTLDSEKFPAIEVRLASYDASSADPKTFASSGTVHGTITIHGVTREIAVPVRVSVDEGRRVVVEGEVPLRMTDFGVAPPRKMGLISVENEVRMWLSLRARASGAAE